jgi:hypothetical protein
MTTGRNPQPSRGGAATRIGTAQAMARATSVGT